MSRLICFNLKTPLSVRYGALESWKRDNSQDPLQIEDSGDYYLIASLLPSNADVCLWTCMCKKIKIKPGGKIWMDFKVWGTVIVILVCLFANPEPTFCKRTQVSNSPQKEGADIVGFVDVTNLCIQFINQVSCFGFSSSFWSNDRSLIFILINHRVKILISFIYHVYLS